jgi:hypothetical protein
MGRFMRADGGGHDAALSRMKASGGPGRGERSHLPYLAAGAREAVMSEASAERGLGEDNKLKVKL